MKETLIQQGDICLADLNPVKGHEQGGFKPVLILQNNRLNEHLNTAIIAPITSNLQMQGYSTTYFLEKKISQLSQDSVALLFQIRTLDKKRLKKRVSNLDKETFREVKGRMALVF
ncbi:MAG: type II toxin-antitoxin system PemK/MazF family toxin [Candidatus Peregrinibacteria bacterium]|nr:type II toxin-antitoxin system PemK/MazF family toxin [Candidatus Peregrinibacteria bacterium]MDZ4245191.1 type II toxin-antitoxin system PemK/MazF family toxin [Candidatus Gracilibacteria bacterium]